MENVNDVFDSINSFSNRVHALDEIRKLKDRIYLLENECGGCKFWMDKYNCPPEKSGKKLSCAERKCRLFVMKPFEIDLIQKHKNRIDALRTSIGDLQK